MNILIIGSDENENECRAKFGDAHNYRRITVAEMRSYSISDSVVFDFEAKDVSVYNGRDLIVFLNSVTTTLSALSRNTNGNATFFGFCGLPTFLNRAMLEVSVLNEISKEALKKICRELSTDYKIVEDTIGMITPRIICMIINEAYFAIEEKVASRADIDLAMKLGTNYPFGPFEWSERIGLENVCAVLKAVYSHGRDERYRICALLESEAKSSRSKTEGIKN